MRFPFVKSILGLFFCTAVVAMLDAAQPASSAKPASQAAAAKLYRGIDVSSWQNKIDWAKVKKDVAPAGDKAAGKTIRFAFLRATRGMNQVDSRFERNVAEARKQKILVGAYHFAKPNLGNTPEDEADFFLKHAASCLKPGDLLPVLDLESGKTSAKNPSEAGGADGYGSDAAGRKKLSDWALAWSARVEAKIGAKPIIYCNTNYAKNFVDASLAEHPLWIANYGAPDSPGTGVWKQWAVWQWSSSTKVDGIAGNVDANVCRVNPLSLTIPARRSRGASHDRER